MQTADLLSVRLGQSSLVATDELSRLRRHALRNDWGMSDNHDDPNSAYRRFEQVAEWPMLALSLAFVGLFVLPDLGHVDQGVVDPWVNLIWAIFGLEVVILFALAPSKRRMLREHWLDILIVGAPFLRPLRISRLLRVVRAGGAIGRTLSAVQSILSRRGFQTFGAFVVVAIISGGYVVYLLERNADGSNINSLSDAMWWSVVTTTTVGYGDHAPVSTDGRAVAVVLMLVGIGLVGAVTANVAAYFVETDREDEIQALQQQLDRIEALLVSR